MMMMNKRKTLITLALLAATALPAHAQFGGLLGGGNKAASGDVDGNVKSFMEKSIVIEKTVNTAAIFIQDAFASEQDRAKLQEQLTAISKPTNPQEANATFAAAYESNSAAIKKLTEGKDLSETVSKLSDDKKKQLAAAVGNFMIGGLQAKDLAPTGQNLISSAGANPANLSKIMVVKDALPRLAGAASLTGSTLPTLVKALKGANVKVMEPTTTSTTANLGDQLK